MVEKQKDDSCRLLHSEGRAVVTACWDSYYSTVVRLQLLFYSINNGNAWYLHLCQNLRQFSFYVILPLLVERVPVALLICPLHSLKVMSPKRKEIYCKEICKTFIYLQDIANVGMLSLTNAPRFTQSFWCLKNIFSTAQKGFRHAPVVNNSKSSGN